MTGGTGFVGKWLLATLLHIDSRLNLGCRISILSRDPGAFSASVPELAMNASVELLQGDIKSFKFPKGEFDVVIHAAADVAVLIDPEEIFATCLEGTRRILDFSRQAGVKDLLLVSSGAVYGCQPAEQLKLSETYSGAPDTLLPSSGYGEGKRISEWLACIAASSSSIQIKIARCFSFVGPYLPLHGRFAIGNFIQSAMKGHVILIKGDGTPYRSYLYAADMAAWLWAVLLKGRSGVAYNVGASDAVSILELAQIINQVLESSADIVVQKVAEPGHMPDRYIPNNNRARMELGLLEPLPLAESIARTAEWHQKFAAYQRGCE